VRTTHVQRAPGPGGEAPRAGIGALLLAALICGVAIIGTVSTASAQTSNDPSPPPITDYANYPLGLGIIPASCTEASAADIVLNPRFSADGGPEVNDLRLLDLTSAGRVSMRWDGFAPGCEGVGLSLSVKASGSTVFDPTIDQVGLRSAYCGPSPGMIPCAAPFELTLLLQDATIDAMPACYQVDASLGPPLAVVGPSGSFYGILNGQFDMLVSAWNGGIAPCGTPVTVTTLAPPTTPPTTAPPATPTTAPPPTASPTSAGAVTTTTCPAGQTMTASGCVAVAGVTATIPRTGAASSGSTSALGLVLIVAGSALVVAAGTLGRRRASL
jgi:hypothetical protein